MSEALLWTDRFEWLNEPPHWRFDGGVLSVETGERTDFWQDTFYGFHRDSGHAATRPVDGDFSALVTFDGDYRALYDQAGLILRIDARAWIKAGIEFTDGLRHFSVVVTLGRSDWSVMVLPDWTGPVTTRLTRHGDAVRVQVQGKGKDGRWQMVRLAPFPAGPARVGPMCCSPERAGFRARFYEVSLGPPIARALHE